MDVKIVVVIDGCGVLFVNIGNGKGKFSFGFGMVICVMGYDM